MLFQAGDYVKILPPFDSDDAVAVYVVLFVDDNGVVFLEGIEG